MAALLGNNALFDHRVNSGFRTSAIVETRHSVTRTKQESVTIAFTTADGQEARATVDTGFIRDAPQPGQLVRVAYDPKRPTDARLLGADDLTELVIMFTVVTLLVPIVWRTGR